MALPSDAWLEHLRPNLLPPLHQLRQELLPKLSDPSMDIYRHALANAPSYPGGAVSLDEDAVSCRGKHLPPQQQQQLRTALESFSPWKKGPFHLYGIDIDAEWRSNLKWDRLVDRIKPLQDQVVADIGCHNGYFMFRMAHQKPRAVLGFEPYAKHYYAFQLLNRYFRQETLFFELFGVEHLPLFPQSFDTIFCLGILYHHTDPINLLRYMAKALRKKGQLIIDCQGIPGSEPVALVPRGKYAGARGIWFLPTLSCLEHWVRRAGFQQVETIYGEPLSCVEQRPTPWAPIKSLASFLQEDQQKTIEGYPAPWRFYLKASL